MTKSSKPRAFRYFAVLDRESNITVALIQAQTVAQVRNHMAAATWNIELADQDAMFAAAKAGLEPIRVRGDSEGTGDE